MPKKKRSRRQCKSNSKLNNLTEAEIEALEVGSRLDHRGKDGKARAGVVVEKKLNGKLLIKYDKVNTDQDADDVYPDQVTVDPFSQLWAFAPVGSLSASPATAEYLKALKPGDTIDLNVPISNGWRMGNIMKWSFDSTGEKLGQVMVEYEEYNSLKYFWLHIDNPEEVALPGQNSGGRRTPKIDTSSGKARNKWSKKRPTVLMVTNGRGKKASGKKSSRKRASAVQAQPTVLSENQPGVQATSKYSTPAERKSFEGESVSDRLPSKPFTSTVKKVHTEIEIKRKPLQRRTHAESKQQRAAEIKRISNEIETSSASHREHLCMKLNSLNRQQEESSCCETPSSGSDIDPKDLSRKKGKQQQQSRRIKQTSYLNPVKGTVVSTCLSPKAKVFIPRKGPNVVDKPKVPPMRNKPESPSLTDQQPEGQPQIPPQIGEKKASIGRFSRPPSVKTGSNAKSSQGLVNSSRFCRPSGTPPPVVKKQPQGLQSQSDSLSSKLQKDVQAPEEKTASIENVPGAPERQSIPAQPQINKPCVPYARMEQPQPAAPVPPFSIPQESSRREQDTRKRLSAVSQTPDDECCEENPNPNDIPLIWFDTDMLDRGLHLDADERDRFLRARALWREEERRRREQEEYYRTSGYPPSHPGSYWRRNHGYYASPPPENYYQPQYQPRYRTQRHALYSLYGNTPRRSQPLHEQSHRRPDFERQGYIREPQPQTGEPIRPPPVPVTPTSAVHGSASSLRAPARQFERGDSPGKGQREGEKEDYVASSERILDQDRVRVSQGVG